MAAVPVSVAARPMCLCGCCACGLALALGWWRVSTELSCLAIRESKNCHLDPLSTPAAVAAHAMGLVITGQAFHDAKAAAPSTGIAPPAMADAGRSVGAAPLRKRLGLVRVARDMCVCVSVYQSVCGRVCVAVAVWL